MNKTLIPAALLTAVALTSSSIETASAGSSAAAFDDCVFGFADPRPEDGPNKLAVHGPIQSSHDFDFYMDWFVVDDETHAAITHSRTVILGLREGAATWTAATLATCPEVPTKAADCFSESDPCEPGRDLRSGA